VANWGNREVTLECSKGEHCRIAVSMIGETHFYANIRGSCTVDRQPRRLKIRNLNHEPQNLWCPGAEFDALPRDHSRPDFQSIQYLSRSAPVSQRPILDNSLDNSFGPRSADLEPWILDRVSRFKLRGSRLVDAGPGVIVAVCQIPKGFIRGRRG